MNVESDNNLGSDQNQPSNKDESLFRKLNPTPEGVEDRNIQLPNSSDFILKETSNGVPPMNVISVQDEVQHSEVADQTNTDSSLDTDMEIVEDGAVIPEGGDYKLPETVVLLDTQWGSKVYLVGTAHFSKQSQEDVAQVINAVKPNVVVLELCTSRSYMLQWEEDVVLKMAEKLKFKVVRETIQNYGVFQGVMYLLLLSVSAQITREMGMAPGGELRRAFKEAIQIPGCSVHLGDRPIEITLRRAFASLSWWQTIKFACLAILDSKRIDENGVEKLKNQDYLEEMLGSFGGEFPQLKKVFVNERDIYLSTTLLNASLCSRGPEGIIPNMVVGVVGMGHVRGIQENWGKILPEEFHKTLEIPPPSRTSRVIKFTLKDLGAVRMTVAACSTTESAMTFLVFCFCTGKSTFLDDSVERKRSKFTIPRRVVQLI